ncbi:MAG: aquaporin [Patescibacteria group bacterium]|jgi:glycerol uptake facilitator-like aquaporin|nr:aquaporin [Patescibacteria group bacterium]
MIKRERVATLVAEFLGTGILTLLVLVMFRSNIGQLSYFVEIGVAFVVATLVYIFGSSSGAILNPAVAIGLWTARKLETLTTVVYVVAELLGAWVAYYLFKYLLNIKVPAVNGHFLGRTLVAEAIGAGVLGLAWGAVAYKKYSNNIKAPLIGIATMVGMLLASSASAGLINPSLALGLRIWVWGTYVAGPVIGAIVGINLFGLLFTSDKEYSNAKKESVAFFRDINASTRTGGTVSKSAGSSAVKRSAPANKRSTSRTKKK